MEHARSQQWGRWGSRPPYCCAHGAPSRSFSHGSFAGRARSSVGAAENYGSSVGGGGRSSLRARRLARIASGMGQRGHVAAWARGQIHPWQEASMAAVAWRSARPGSRGHHAGASATGCDAQPIVKLGCTKQPKLLLEYENVGAGSISLAHFPGSVRRALQATAPANLFYVALLSLSAALYLAVTRRRTTSRLPPGPTGLPLVGSIPFIHRNLHICFADLAAKHGPVFAIRLGSKVEIVVTSPDLAREVLRDKDAVFSNRVMPDAGRAVAFDGVENIVGAPVGPKWGLLRRLCAQEMLSPAGLDRLYGLRRREFRSTLRYLYSQSNAGEAVDLGALMFVNTMNVVTSSLWGGTIGSESERAAIGKEFRPVLNELTELLASPNLSDFFPVLAPLDLQGMWKKMERIRVRFDHIFDKIIQQRVKAQQDGSEMATDFLESMLKVEREGGDGKATFTMADVKSLLLDMVAGATETTSNTVEWAMAEMIQKPQVLRKVQEELDKVVGRDAIVEESHLHQLHYLRMVIKETLRLHPALPLMVPHSPSEESTIGGYHIPAGCRVFVNVWAIHRNPHAWSEPLEFNPERFSGDGGGRKWDFTGSQFDYFPFGSGKRICAGITMADKMTTYSLAMLLQAFDWKLPHGAKLDLSEKFGVVMKKATPLVIIPKTRLPEPDVYFS